MSARLSSPKHQTYFNREIHVLYMSLKENAYSIYRFVFCLCLCVCKQKSESEETEFQKPHVKLRRSISEAPRPASTPPTIAGGEREEGDEEKLAAELEVSTCITCIEESRQTFCTLMAKVLMLVINVHMSQAPDVSGEHPPSSAITFTHAHTHTYTHWWLLPVGWFAHSLSTH